VKKGSRKMELITTIEFKSLEKYYIKECAGSKKNTVRQITEEEKIIISKNLTNIKYIRIKSDDGTQSFVRKLTDITLFDICDYNLIRLCIFSW
jgi:hypothetical protein